MYPIHDFGGQAQRQQCLPQMSLGTLIDCLGLTEPHDGSRPANMKTHTKRRGGDYLSIGGISGAAVGGGDDLGNCASFSELSDLVEDRDPKGNLTFQIRVAGNIAIKAVTVPAD